MDNELKLIDIADDLIIINRNTIEKLYCLDNSSDCIALYIFYYKIAKWQKTDTVKANDTYVQKCLNWGRKKILNTKKILKENGLIEVVQRRENDKISGWFIRVHYIVSEKNISNISIEQEVLNQEVSNSTCSLQETNALRDNIKCLKNKNKLLEEENNKLKSLLKERKEDLFDVELFNKFWNAYPKKQAKGNAEKWFEKNLPDETLVNTMIEKIEQFKNTDQWKKDNGQFIPLATSWLNAKRWEDEIEQPQQNKPIGRKVGEGAWQL